MGRFSCLYGHLHNHKQKKSAQPSFETMIKMLQVSSPDHTSASSRIAETPVGKKDVNFLGNGTEQVSPSSYGWRSREFECEYDAESNLDSVHFETGNFRRSLSVGCDLDQKRRMSDDDKTDDCVDQELSFEGSHDFNDTVDLSPTNAAKSAEANSPDHDQEALQSLSPNCSSDLVNRESIFSFPTAKYLEEEAHDDYHEPFIAEHADGCERETPEASRMSKSYSMPNFDRALPTSPCVSADLLPSHSRSFEDLNILGIEKEDISAHDARVVDIGKINNDDSFCPFEKLDGENAALDNYDSFEYGCSSKDWIVPVPDDMGIIEHNRVDDSSSNHWGHFPGQDFKTRRIEDWVIDLQHCSPVEETTETAISNSPVKRASTFLEGLDKMEMKLNPGVEAAKRYISSLNASATTVQLANHGLVAIPLLVAFASLKVLNLSGNSIVRITAGSLPRGLHMLNLSKNKLSTIEGLRELTRLRVLDLSYNKISRIGHGLASCSSVKELYLAGNKISEVEGLHRLLKLAVLDLRFNKIATSKSLGQLAANYNSLQAISLEGNPAQKNVGDEQLKKFLQGLLPQLAYYNRQHIKSSTLKDSSDRAVRLGISSHQFDRGVKSDHKSSSRRSVSKRASHANSSHGQKSQASDSLKQSKGKHVAVAPPSSSRASNHNKFLDIGSKLRGLKLGAPLHKSRSEGALAEV
ncbi:hypothetical protein KSS87_017988 [Heliosperma pusillum]|nr:hypothetical protein KSS87_017988 [Heliosperma pusillum]